MFWGALFALLSLPDAAHAIPVYTTPQGDLTLDGEVQSNDLVCMVKLWQAETVQPNLTSDQCASDNECPNGEFCGTGFFGNTLCIPTCQQIPTGADPLVNCPAAGPTLCNGTVQRQTADTNCDNDISPVDFSNLIKILLEAEGGPGTFDWDDDNITNQCDDHCLDAQCESGCETALDGYLCDQCNDGYFYNIDHCQQGSDTYILSDVKLRPAVGTTEDSSFLIEAAIEWLESGATESTDYKVTIE